MGTLATRIFADELSVISNPRIVEFVVDCFEKFTPEYFWTVPASTSGKYHPKVSIGPGGLVRHTKLAVWWGLQLMNCWPELHDEIIDEAIAALLLHDLNKNGEKLNSRGYSTLKNGAAYHGIYLAKKITEMRKDKHTDDFELSIKRIIFAIESHMGRWSDSEYPVSGFSTNNKCENLCFLVHLADYCASRKCDSAAKQIKEGFDHTTTITTYGIGEFKEGDTDDLDNLDEYGMWDGPNPDLHKMLSTDGRSNNSVIVEFAPFDFSSKIIYKWDQSNLEWVAE